jgi:exodeoxyribonuclease-3
MQTLRFISWNVNGIRAVIKKNGFDWLKDEKVDLLALQEIKADSEQIPDDLFGGRFKYHSINASQTKRGQSGVAIWTNIRGKADACEDVDILREGRIIEYIFDKIAFYNVYFPNGQSSRERLAYKLAFYDRFLEHIEARRKAGYSIVFCGDVNTAHREIDIARPKANENTSGFLPIERAWIDKVIAHGYVDTFRHLHPDEKDRYSWWSYRMGARKRNVGWRIDYFFVSQDLKERILEAEILDHIEGSDHAPVTLTLSL